MKFTCEIQIVSGRVIKKIYYADTLTELSEQIVTDFPTGKMVSAIGGGTD